MRKWHPRDEFSCREELDRLDAENRQLRKRFVAVCETDTDSAYELSRQMQALRKKMFELEKKEYDRLVKRPREAAQV